MEQVAPEKAGLLTDDEINDLGETIGLYLCIEMDDAAATAVEVAAEEELKAKKEQLFNMRYEQKIRHAHLNHF